MKRYDLAAIMKRAWKQFRKNKDLGFAECLHRAWLSEKAKSVNAERIERAKAAAGVTEAINTWAGWKKAGYEVIHGMKKLFSVTLVHGSRGDDAVYTASFFSESQVRPITA